MLVMEQGKVRQLDTPEQIRENPADAFVRELVSGFGMPGTERKREQDADFK